jgi:NADPH-dependent 2,4-dienoyl-CoA reductase/sulfur reductase-like enzyme
MSRRLIVIGGVAAGTSAASRARRTDPKLEIILFERGEYISYGACDEPFFLGGEIDRPERLLVRRPEVFREKQNIDIRLMHEVTKIIPPEKKVEVKNLGTGETETYNYDALILATGARPRTLDVPGTDPEDLEGIPNLFYLKFLQQAILLDRFLKEHKPKKAVTSGAGFIALEMAEAFHARGIENTIINRSNRVGGRLEPEIQEEVREILKEKGVRCQPDTIIQGFEKDDAGMIRKVKTDKGDLEADLVLCSIGAVPVVELAQAAGVKLGKTGAIAVNERMETNIPGIFAAGDCSETLNRVSRENVFTPLGDIANKHGWTAGENAAGGNITYPGALGSWMFKCFELQVGATGLLASDAERLGFNVFTNLIEHRSRAHAQPKSKKIIVKLVADKKTHRLLGAQIAGREGAALRINTLAMALYNQMTVDELANVDLAYTPPFSPVIDPILIAARDATKAIAR